MCLTGGFHIPKIWHILKHFTGIFRQAQTIKFWGVWQNNTNTLGGWVSPAYLLACQAYNKKRVILGLVQLKLRILYQK